MSELYELVASIAQARGAKISSRELARELIEGHADVVRAHIDAHYEDIVATTVSRYLRELRAEIIDEVAQSITAQKSLFERIQERRSQASAHLRDYLVERLLSSRFPIEGTWYVLRDMSAGQIRHVAHQYERQACTLAKRAQALHRLADLVGDGTPEQVDRDALLEIARAFA